MSYKIKPKLSKGILEMKFMKKTRDKVIKQEEAEEGRAMYSNEITKEMMHGISNYFMEPSYAICEGLIDGRLSFRGMNPELERLMELEEMAKQAEEEGVMDKDVSDNDMAEHYESNVTKNINKKFKTKKRVKEEQEESKPQKEKKMKFKRPQED